jgi:hypothetical protein
MTDSPQNSQVAASAQTSQTAATPASEMPATPVSQTAATPVPDARVPRTHTSPAIIQMLKIFPWYLSSK